MRKFNYDTIPEELWPTAILELLSEIHEYQGRYQAQLEKQTPALLRLKQAARQQSMESEAALSGIWINKGRMNNLIEDRIAPRNATERNICGYRYCYDVLLNAKDRSVFSLQTVSRLQSDLHHYAGASSNALQLRQRDRRLKDDASLAEELSLPLLEASALPRALETICREYNRAILSNICDPLLIIPVFLLDFLCMQPYQSGNEQLSHLLLRYLLQQNHSPIGMYVSLEKKIGEGRETYTSAMRLSRQGWKEGVNDFRPIIAFYLSVIRDAWSELDDKIRNTDTRKSALETVRSAVNARTGRFTKSEIRESCPSIGRASVENSLTALVNEGVLLRRGKGRATWYIRTDNRKGE